MPKPQIVILSYDGFVPVVGSYNDGELTVNEEENRWIFGRPE